MFLQLTRIRELLKISQTALAKRLGISPSLVSHWEAGLRTPSEAQILNIAEALGITVDYLLNGEQTPTFKFRARATLNAEQKDEVEKVLRDSSQLLFVISSVHRLSNIVPKPFALSVSFDFDDSPRLAMTIRDTMRLNKRVSLVELKQALAEWNVFVFEWYMPMEVSGLSHKGENTLIIINSQHTKERRLFTLAHEFSHILFHLGSTSESSEVSIVASNRDPIEKQANHFATELIMPSSEVDGMIKEWGREKLRQPTILHYAAKSFNVSIDAMFYRLAKRRIFEWPEKLKYIPPSPAEGNGYTHRVTDIFEQTSPLFLKMVLDLYAHERVSEGKITEWLFCPLHSVHEQLRAPLEQQETGLTRGEGG